MDIYTATEQAYKNGYEQGKKDAIPEGSVVLTGEEAERFRGQTVNILKERKNGIKDFAKTLISVVWEEEEDETIRIKDLHGVIRDIADANYGVKIKE